MIRPMLPEVANGNGLTGDGAGCLEGAYSSNDSVMSIEETTAMLRARRLMLEDNVESRRGTSAMKIMTILGTRPEIIRLSWSSLFWTGSASTSWFTPARTTTTG